MIIKKLNESKQVGTLYRIVNVKGILDVLNNNRIKSYNYPYISFTRSSRMKSYEGIPPRSIFRLVLDGDKLSEKYKIQPVSDYHYNSNDKKIFYSRYNEFEKEVFEELVMTNEIKQADNYITRIDILLDNLEFEIFKDKDYTDIFYRPYMLEDIINIIFQIKQNFPMQIIENWKVVSEDRLKDYNLKK